MYSSIRIRGFRGLDDFRMEGLGRVNLLVGANNCGKTSVLECVQLLSSPTERELSSVFSDIAFRRGEWHALADGESDPTYALELSSLFARRDMSGEVVVSAGRSGQQSNGRSYAGDELAELTLCVRESQNRDFQQGAKPRPLRARCSAANYSYDVSLTVDGSLRKRPRFIDTSSSGAQFLDGNRMTATVVAGLLGENKKVLTENKELATRALRILEPRIESVEADEGQYALEAPAGIFVKLRDVQERVPIGSTGEGIWRMLGLALMLARAKDGFLLVDEIGAGLHYAALENMWRLVWEQAAALSVQVFATTHSPRLL